MANISTPANISSATVSAYKFENSPVNDSTAVNLTLTVAPPNATAIFGLFGLLLLDSFSPPVWMRSVGGFVSVIVFIVGGIGNLTILTGFASNKHGKIRHVRNINIFVLTVFDTLLSTVVCAQQSLRYVAGVYLCSYVYFTAWGSAIAFLWLGSWLTLAVFAYSNFLHVALPNISYRAHETLQRTWLRVIVIGIAIPLTVFGVSFINLLVNNKNDNKTVFSLTNERCVGDGMIKRPFSTLFWSIIFLAIPVTIMTYYLIKTSRRMRAQRVQQQPVISFNMNPITHQLINHGGIYMGTTASEGAGNEVKHAHELERKRRALRLSTWVVLTAELCLLPYMACQFLMLAFAMGFLRRDLVWYYRLYDGAFLIGQVKSAIDPLCYITILPEFRQMALELWQPVLDMWDSLAKWFATNKSRHSTEGINSNIFNSGSDAAMPHTTSKHARKTKAVGKSVRTNAL